MPQRYVVVSYKMLTHSPVSHKLLYETPAEQPVAFVTGMGLMIDAFEQHLTALNPGDDFDFVLKAADAFGERDEELVRALPRKVFEIRGKFLMFNLILIIHFINIKIHSEIFDSFH